MRDESGVDQSFERFLQEYEIARRLRHPNLVHCHELGVADEVREVDQLEAEAHVGLIAAEAAHAFGVGEAWEGRRDLEVGTHGLGQGGVERFDEGEDVFLAHEAHLEVELGELRLTVGAEVFVAETASDLEVALEAGNH